MKKKCEACGDTFEAKRASRRTCTERCRKRLQRKPAAAVVQLAAVQAFADEPQDPGPSLAAGKTETLTRRELEAAGRLDTALGVVAVIAAQQVDALLVLTDTGSGIKARIEAHRSALAEALKDAKTADDPLSKIRAAAALKLVSGGRS